MKLDNGQYELNLALERRERGLSLSQPISFDNKLHPRDWKGQFKKSLGGMKRGDVRELPSGVKVERKYANYKVTSPNGDSISPKSLTDTVDHAMKYDAKTTHEESIGGTKSTTVADATKEAEGSVDPKVVRSALDDLGIQHSHLVDNQIANTRQHILEIIDPPGKPPAKDGAEVRKRILAKPGNWWRGAVTMSVFDNGNEYAEKRAFEAVKKLRGK